MEITYNLYLNGRIYGIGNAEYMVELIRDYVVACELYGHSEVKFEIKKVGYGGISETIS